jgi:hypothetical protein
MSDPTDDSGEAWRSRARWALAGFAMIAAFLLLAEHRAHVLPLLPWLILLACPLMHVFMHGEHLSRGERPGGENRRRDADEDPCGTNAKGSSGPEVAPKENSRRNDGGRR